MITSRATVHTDPDDFTPAIDARVDCDGNVTADVKQGDTRIAFYGKPEGARRMLLDLVDAIDAAVLAGELADMAESERLRLEDDASRRTSSCVPMGSAR